MNEITNIEAIHSRETISRYTNKTILLHLIEFMFEGEVFEIEFYRKELKGKAYAYGGVYLPEKIYEAIMNKLNN